MKGGHEEVLVLGYSIEPIRQAEGSLLTVAAAAAAKSFQSCPTLCNPIDSSPPGSSVHVISQARVLEWGVIALSLKRVSRT